MPAAATYTAFARHRIIARGPLADVALVLHRLGPVADGALVFDDSSGAVTELDLRGTAAEVLARLPAPPPPAPPAPPAPGSGPRQRGRPRLGVQAREVTLLPRHWDWLAAQEGGASAAIRRLVDAARKADGGRTERRIAQARAYRFLSAIGGDLPGFEEAARALFADNREAFTAQGRTWPGDVAAHTRQLAWGGDGA
jgi:hypothetical protein